jgi:hypothetical protein
MKTIQKGLITFFSVLIIISCTKTETTPPTGADKNATLLAGAKGGSKSWKITSISQASGGSTQTITAASGAIPACEADNIFIFTNNATQTYQATEGATTCNTGDPATLESGSWAFTTDGNNLLIDATVYITSTQVASTGESLVVFFILSQGEPLTVSAISDSSMTLTYNYTDTSGSTPVAYTFTLVFTKQ